MGVSVKEVAKRAGVSVGTVSNVLNRPESVRADTIDRVNAAIAELGYVPNDAARQLRAGQSTQIALLVLDIGNPFFADVARGAERQAALTGHTVLLANSDDSHEREAAHLDQFERQRVAGVLLVPSDDAADRVARLRERGIPVVLVDRGTADSSVASVAVDDVVGGKTAAQHILDQGRRRIVFVGGPLAIAQARDRLAGAQEAVDAVDGASLDILETTSLSLEQGMAAGARIQELVAEGKCDAVFAANDLLAIGLQQSMLTGAGRVTIPGDVVMVGYDDISFAAAAVVPITSVRQPRERIGSTAVELLMKERDAADGAVREHVLFQPELVVRASSTAQ
ncbi:LacI family DNA-binding transcriptional regulator [Demequina sediminicola]|uniref:LacI family DNA-binding transcriptional regulator n=1 Tax=Demequina sediminicola TaxID=1095026 RepID=UPI0007864BFB|nr:LacI family DNA-binding transcriptional regulator [Demequina sediminicola]